MDFEFREVGRLTDGTVDVLVEGRQPADPVRRHCPAYNFAVLLPGTEQKVGAVRLRLGRIEEYPSLLFAGHVGYEIDEPYRGHGFAARACRLLRSVASAHGFSALVITCDPENMPSRRTCEKLGAAFLGTFEIPRDHEMYEKGSRKVRRYEWRTDDGAAEGA